MSFAFTNNGQQRQPSPSQLHVSTDESVTATTTQVQPTPASLEKLEIVKLALKRPRGASIGVEYLPNPDADEDVSILSMQLRKVKAAAMYTSNASCVSKFVKEQESARGDFPGPLPVIYTGSSPEEVVEGEFSATAVVLDYGKDEIANRHMENTGIIWRVSNINQIQEAINVGNAGDVLLLPQELISDGEEENAELKEVLCQLPKSTVTIAAISSMLPENKEVTLGKMCASMGISSLLIQNCCVGDEEDLKYASYVIESISKKSSSSFSMTGLTGSTNGHFGTSSHMGEVKWRRNL
jgi:hypothetical protein